MSGALTDVLFQKPDLSGVDTLLDKKRSLNKKFVERRLRNEKEIKNKDLSQAKQALDAISRNRNFGQVMFKSKEYREAHRILEKCAELDAIDRALVMGCENASILFEIETDSGAVMLPIEKVDTARYLGDRWAAKKCGMCRTCLAFKTVEWADRATMEFMARESATQITFTTARTPEYDQPPLAVLMHFMRKFRMNVNYRLKKAGIKYTADQVIEYGTQKRRRHGHGNYYGVDLLQMEEIIGGRWETRTDKMEPYWTVHGSKYWPLGFLAVQPITDARGAAYNAKYCQKSALLLHSEKAEERHYITKVLGDPLLRSYYMSPRKPSLGDDAIKKIARQQMERIMDELPEGRNKQNDNCNGFAGVSVRLENGRPAILTRRHKEMVASMIAGRLKKPVSVRDLFPFDQEAKGRAIKDALIGPEIDRFRISPILGEKDMGDPAGLYAV